MSVLSIGAARAAVITVAAASALALLALPSAAHAAEVVTCTQQVTPDTQPWLTFSESDNLYAPLASAVTEYLGTTLDLTSDFPASFTAEDLDEYEEAMIAAEEAMQAALEGGLSGEGIAALGTALEEIDPDNTTGWQEKLETLFAAFIAEAETTDYEAAFQAFESDLEDFSDAAAALVEADVPAGGPFERPAIPESLQTNADTATVALQEVVSLFQSIVLDGAVAYVVYEEVCVTTTVPDAAVVVAPKTLAATGTSDGIALGTAAGLLLLVGAAATAVTIRRRQSA